MSSQGGSAMIRESLVDVIETDGEVKSVASKVCVPSRAIIFNVSLLCGSGWESRVDVEGSGLGSVAQRCARSKVYGLGLSTAVGSRSAMVTTILREEDGKLV